MKEMCVRMHSRDLTIHIVRLIPLQNRDGLSWYGIRSLCGREVHSPTAFYLEETFPTCLWCVGGRSKQELP